MSPDSENYCDFQQFLLFRNKARNAGRSQKIAGMQEISQNAGFDCGTVDTYVIVETVQHRALQFHV